MQKKQFIHKKPAYYRGQLLDEDDFRDEQRYHAGARYRHNLNLHGWGIVRGLEVRHAGGNEIVVSPGFAVDGRGHEIDLHDEEKIQLPTNEANAVLVVSLIYEEEDSPSPNDESERNTRKCYGVVSVLPGAPEAAVILATIELDDKSHVDARAIKDTNRRHLKTMLAPGSVTAESLDAPLRCGWLRMPFRPVPLPAERGESAPPAFRVGPTEARSYHDDDERSGGKGAAGTMAIPVAPGVARILRFRVAGEVNEGRLSVELFIGGWDAGARKHVARSVLKHEIAEGPYDQTWTVRDGGLHLETSTVSVEVRCDAYARISLVALEVCF
jgi:hypothetical protein